MKVFSLTDVSTPKLEAHKLVGQTVVVGTALLQPGGSDEIADEAHTRAGAEFLVSVGAIAFDKLPPSYVAAPKLAFPAPPAPAQPAPVPAPPPVVEEKVERMVEAPKSKRGDKGAGE